MAERIHSWLLHYIPLIGYAVYGCMVGFDDKLFRYLIFSGGIVLAVYQTVLASIYVKPKSYFLAIFWMLLPIALLVAYALMVDQFYWHYVFLEFTAVDLTAMLVALLIAFAAKAVRERGVGGGFLGPVVFTSILFGGMVFLFVLLFWEFFKRTNFDYLNMIIICLAVGRSTFSFFWEINPKPHPLLSCGIHKSTDRKSLLETSLIQEILIEYPVRQTGCNLYGKYSPKYSGKFQS